MAQECVGQEQTRIQPKPPADLIPCGFGVRMNFSLRQGGGVSRLLPSWMDGFVHSCLYQMVPQAAGLSFQDPFAPSQFGLARTLKLIMFRLLP